MPALPSANIRNRFSFHTSSLSALPAALLGFLLGGCVISTPFRGPGFVDGKVTNAAPETEVVVSITHATVNRDRRGPFDEHVDRVVKSLPAQPGLIGYAVRKELFGDEVWTMTVWRSEADRARFVASSDHRAAMAAGGSALKAVRFSRVVVPAGELPLSWDRARLLLDSQARSY